MDPYRGSAAAGGSRGGDAHGQILWDWQAGEHCESNDAVDATKFVWDCLNQDDDELLGLLGNQTPLRDCCDLFADIGDITCKETLDLEESREPKRRRTLEYPLESSQSEFGNHETSSTLVTSEVTEISLFCTDEPQSLNYDMQQNANDLDTMNSLSNGAPYRPEDNHLENCSDRTPMFFRPDQTPCSQESVTYIDDQTGVSATGTSEIAPVTESLIMQETMKLSTLKVSKGGSSLSKVKQNLTTSIAYPFTLIKPSWEEGDVTLNDINQRIRAPLKKPPEILGTSAFSGKPVIGKTRIRTEGGKGSITILRTKG
ncbi:protein XRI1-like isoform X4 [Phragmites australis]|uniref:protein XRI1-like isoform X4 n=1 Tax=Phragmites australis TaxID=29695 RepID=UPI002D76836F|nr:protein XRI1-like isoform X4 [Phragmites australis]